jgi:hypothetical protein
MIRSLYILGTTALMSCLAGSGYAEPPPATAETPTTAAIADKMSAVTGDLAKKQTGEPVQNQQKKIVRDLDALIASLEKQNDNRGDVSSNNPRIPMADSRIKRGTGGIGDLVDPGQSEKDWAKLSSRERDRILQSMSEGFPPEYRTVLERYYRRLADEKTVVSAAETAKPKETAPAVSAKP